MTSISSSTTVAESNNSNAPAILTEKKVKSSFGVSISASLIKTRDGIAKIIRLVREIFKILTTSTQKEFKFISDMALFPDLINISKMQAKMKL